MSNPFKDCPTNSDATVLALRSENLPSQWDHHEINVYTLEDWLFVKYCTIVKVVFHYIIFKFEQHYNNVFPFQESNSKVVNY